MSLLIETPYSLSFLYLNLEWKNNKNEEWENLLSSKSDIEDLRREIESKSYLADLQAIYVKIEPCE